MSLPSTSRDLNWHPVLDVFDRAARGTGGVVLVDGDHGVGKTWVVDSVCTAAMVNGLTVLTPDFDVDPAENIQQVLDSRFPGVPALIALDDLHLMNRTRVQLLHQAVLCTARQPVVWVLACRRQAGGPDVSALFAEGGLPDAARLRLESWSELEVSAFLHERLGPICSEHASSLAQKARGNPLWLTTLVDGLSGSDWPGTDAIPRTVLSAVKDRLGRLSLTSRMLLALTAHCGGEVDLARVQHVFKIPAAALAAVVGEAGDGDLIEATDLGFRFRYELVRDSVAALTTAALDVHNVASSWDWWDV